MDTANLPIHVQMMLALRAKVEARQRQHEGRCGQGLPDQEYQRHVGRIAECKHQVEAINEMMKADLDDISDFLENHRNEREERRPQRGARTGQRQQPSAAHQR